MASSIFNVGPDVEYYPSFAPWAKLDLATKHFKATDSKNAHLASEKQVLGRNSQAVSKSQAFWFGNEALNLFLSASFWCEC